MESFGWRCGCQHLPGAVVIHLQDASVTVNTCWSGGSDWKRSCVFIACLCGLILIADWTMVTTIRLQQLAALAESDGWGDTQGWDEHLTWPHGSILALLVARHQCWVLRSTSRVGARVDWQVLGYSPQDLLLGLFPIFPLQQLFVSVGQMKLCGAEHTNNTYDLLIGCAIINCPACRV